VLAGIIVLMMIFPVAGKDGWAGVGKLGTNFRYIPFILEASSASKLSSSTSFITLIAFLISSQNFFHKAAFSYFSFFSVKKIHLVGYISSLLDSFQLPQFLLLQEHPLAFFLLLECS
jgi:hypothetical protein